MKKMMLATLIAGFFAVNAYAETAAPAIDTKSQKDAAVTKGLGISTDKINAVGQSSTGTSGSASNLAIPKDGSVQSAAGSVTAIGIVGGNATNMATGGGKSNMDIGANSNVSAGKDITAIGIVGGDATNMAIGKATADMAIGKNNNVMAAKDVTAIGIVGGNATNMAQDDGSEASMRIGANGR